MFAGNKVSLYHVDFRLGVRIDDFLEIIVVSGGPDKTADVPKSVGKKRLHDAGADEPVCTGNEDEVVRSNDVVVLHDRPLLTVQPGKQQGQGLVGRRLGPMEHRGLGFDQRVLSIIEMTVRILHVLYPPHGNLLGHIF